jgi:hypothetical protein
MAVPVAQQPVPRFRGSIRLFTIHVQVVADPGKPMASLTAEQFDVRIQGRKRGVTFAELMHFDEGPVLPARSKADAVKVLSDESTEDTDARNGGVEFKRISSGISAHYLLGVESNDSDRGGFKNVRVRVNQRNLNVRQWAWGTVPWDMPQAATPNNR